MTTRNNVRYRVAMTREEAHEFVDAIFNGKILGDPEQGRDDPYPVQVLFVAADLRCNLGLTSSHESTMVAKTPGRGERLWEPDASGHYVGCREERLQFMVTRPGVKTPPGD